MLLLALALAIVPLNSANAETTVRAMFAAFNRHDATAMTDLYADETQLTSSDFCSPRGKRDVTRTYTALFTAFPDIMDRIDDIIVLDDQVAV